MRALLPLALLAATTGCNDVVCGTGTFANGNDCVGFDPNDKTPPVVSVSPTGGRTRDPLPDLIKMTTDEPARIIYTTDGSDPDPMAPGEPSPVTIVGVTQGEQLKYVAIDRAGNATPPTTTTFISDTVGPAPVSGLTVTLTGSTPHITWTPPTDPDYVGVVLARVGDIVDVAPPPGQMLTNGTDLSTSLKIVSVGTATSFDDVAASPGPIRYVAWAYDDLGNYSTGKAAQTSIPLGSFNATLTVNTTNNTVTVTTPPANLDLSGSTAALAGSTLTVSLSIKNNTTQYFQNPKIEIVSATNGSFSGADGTADAHPFKKVGTGLMLAPAATKSVPLVFTGVTGGTTVTINALFATHSSLITLPRTNQQALIDFGSGLQTVAFASTARGPQDRLGGRIRPGVLTGGRYVDLPTSHGTIERFDMVTGTKSNSVALGEGDRTNIQWLISTRGELLAMIKHAGKRRVGGIELVRLDEGLHELGRVKLPYSDDQGFTRPAVSADGNVLAFPVVGGILLLDVPTLSPIDAVTATPMVVDLITTGFTDRVHGIAFFDGTNGIFAVSRFGGQSVSIRRANGDYTKTLFTDTVTNQRTFSAATGPDGRIYFGIGVGNGIRAFDPTNDTVSTVGAYGPVPNGVAAVEGQLWVIRDDRQTIDQISTTGTVVRTLTSQVMQGTSPTSAAYGHTLDSLR